MKRIFSIPFICTQSCSTWFFNTLKGTVFQDVDYDIQVDENARAYRAHFLGYEHYNFYGADEQQVIFAF